MTGPPGQEKSGMISSFGSI